MPSKSSLMEQCTLYHLQQNNQIRTDNTMLSSGSVFLSSCSIASFSSNSKPANSGVELWDKALLTKNAQAKVITVNDEKQKQTFIAKNSITGSPTPTKKMKHSKIAYEHI